MFLLAILFAAVQAHEFAPLKITSCYYGLNDCMGINNVDSLDVDELRSRGCPIVEQERLFGLIETEESRATSAFRIRSGCRDFSKDFEEDMDAMPISFNYNVIDGLEPERFVVTRNDGVVDNPECVMFEPAGEDDEKRTIVLLGHWGDGDALTTWPVKVEIKGKLLFNVNGVVESGDGLVFDDENKMRWDTSLYLNEAVLMPFEKDSGGNGCNHQVGGESKWHLKIALCGGGTLDSLTTFEPGDKNIFELLDRDGNVLTTGYRGLADVGDMDNFYDLCLDESFDVDSLYEVKATCDPDRNTVIMPPKAKYGCTPHTMEVDKSRITEKWKNMCKCNFDVKFDSACDPEGLMEGPNYCKVPRSTNCRDAKYRWFTYSSRDACKFAEEYSKGDAEALAFEISVEDVTPFDVALYACAALGVLAILYLGFSRCQARDIKEIPTEDTPLHIEA